jgi:hypothetical protein
VRGPRPTPRGTGRDQPDEARWRQSHSGHGNGREGPVGRTGDSHRWRFPIGPRPHTLNANRVGVSVQALRRHRA